jgi:hypothetical protein
MGAWFYFLITLLTELPIVLLFFRKEWKFALLIGFLLNLFTWPLLHVLLFYSNINLNILELGVATTESLGFYLLMQCSGKKALALGFIANATSYGIGLILNSYL